MRTECQTIHEVLPPGRRASAPHSHTHMDEMIIVLEGSPTVVLGDEMRRLERGGAVGFSAGDSRPHTLFNETQEMAHLLVVKAKAPEDRVIYPASVDGSQTK